MKYIQTKYYELTTDSLFQKAGSDYIVIMTFVITGRRVWHDRYKLRYIMDILGEGGMGRRGRGVGP